MNMSLLYKTVPANTTDESTKVEINDLLEKIANGWEILSAVGVAGGVHYILVKKEPAQRVIPDKLEPSF